MTKSTHSGYDILDLLTISGILQSETDNTTLPYQFQEVKVVVGHKALMSETRLHFRAIRQRKQMQVLRSGKKQQDERVVMFLHLLFVIGGRGGLPRDSTRDHTILFIESYIIPEKLRYKAISL